MLRQVGQQDANEEDETDGEVGVIDIIEWPAFVGLRVVLQGEGRYEHLWRVFETARLGFGEKKREKKEKGTEAPTVGS